MRLIPVLLLMVVLAGCGRPLSPGEAAFAARLHGDTLDTGRIRFVDGALVGKIEQTRKRRPRRTCRERLLPPPQGETVTVAPAGVAIHNRVFFSRDWYRDDYLPDWPRRMSLTNAMLLAHELTHVWQWQNRDVTGYSPLGAVREHNAAADPYLFEIGTAAPRLLDYGYEQQASIVEEYVCCATLDPGAPRTRRLAAMLRGAFPVRALPEPGEVTLPWPEADTDGICR